MSTIIATTLSNGSVSVPTATVVNGSAKAWVNFNGTGTIAARDSFNLSSLTDNGTGDYTVNFATSMVNANYVFYGTGTGVNGSDYPTWLSYTCTVGTSTPILKTTSQFRFGNFSGWSGAVGYKDSAEINAAVVA